MTRAMPDDPFIRFDPEFMDGGSTRKPDWSFGLFILAIVVVVTVFTIAVAVAVTVGNRPTEHDLVADCRDMGGTVILDNRNNYDGCEVRP